MKYSDMIKKAWEDPKFKEELFKKPQEVLEKEGIEIPQGKKVFIHENTFNEIHFVLPQKPEDSLAEDSLSDEVLEAISGGLGGLRSRRQRNAQAGREADGRPARGYEVSGGD